MDANTQITGALPMVIIISTILTTIVSVILLKLYHKGVIKGMAKRVGMDNEASHHTRTEKTNLQPLQIKTYSNDDSSIKSSDFKSLYIHSKRSLRALVLVYSLGGLAYALVMTIAYILITGDGFLPLRFIWLLSCFVWPTIITIILVTVPDGKKALLVIGAYFMMILLLALIVLARNPQLNLGQVLFFWIYVNAPATLLLYAFLRKQIRAVGPIVLAFMIFGVAGSFMAINIFDNNDVMLLFFVELGSAIGLEAYTMFMLMLLMGFAIFSILGWKLLKILGHRYRAKHFSDQSLTLDSVWVIFGILHTISLSFEGLIWMLAGLIALVGYKIVTIILFRLRRTPEYCLNPSPNLLLLRVFALGRRSARFFDSFSKLWRCSGSISLIAGPDLISRIVEPNEFLDFIGGNMSRKFVKDQADLNERLLNQDQLPDPDGRYRVNEFFCRADTWKMTMRQLSEQSDAVLMDLRSFTPGNQGCIYELGQLIDTISLENTVILVDETTDISFLKETLLKLWQGVHSESPNLKFEAPKVRLLHAKVNGLSIRNLLYLLSMKPDSLSIK